MYSLFLDKQDCHFEQKYFYEIGFAFLVVRFGITSIDDELKTRVNTSEVLIYFLAKQNLKMN